ncbi:hypothetical protein GQX73_g10554 [Xylaria multiplex]|uniref:Uncharacterized protein n=1 Tax=Xylaria multiplex TaxID=323545 RepID=A0A7C8ISP8_9PEZI|nr:hypothetical protein GQX73_g10554 [Xylaria multiplex]
MPVLSLPVQQTQTLIPTGLIPPEQVHFLFTFAGVLVGPIALLALVVSCSRRYKTSLGPVLVKGRSTMTTGERPLKQSHEINSGRIMSASRKSENSPSGAHRNLDEDGLGGRRGQSQSPSTRQRYQEEPRTLKGSTDELRNLKARPPPAMPLTQPVLSTPFFSLQDRRLSVAASTHNDFDPTLPYGASSDFNSPGSTTTIIPDSRPSSSISLRKSYTKILPIDPLQPSSSTGAELDDTSSAFAPSSFPSSSPILPIAPHAALHSKEIDVTGEIISVMDDSGAGWKRHTRVYGGGVCLACLASGGHDGGFYGENVPLDQRR